MLGNALYAAMTDLDTNLVSLFGLFPRGARWLVGKSREVGTLPRYRRQRARADAELSGVMLPRRALYSMVSNEGTHFAWFLAAWGVRDGVEVPVAPLLPATHVAR